MDIAQIIKRIKYHPESEKMGMIASHLGIVRGNSRNGRGVSSVDVKFDHEGIERIIRKIKSMDGIIEVIVEVNEGLLNVGDDVMFVAVGGDIRDNVFPALIQTVELMKEEAGKKKEFFTE